MNNTLILAYEMESSCAKRLVSTGLCADRAAEIAFYLAQSTDILREFAAIERACSEQGIRFVPVEAGSLHGVIPRINAETSAFWLLTDGTGYFEGSFATAAAAAAGLQQIGSEGPLFFLAQDKFRSTAIMRALGLPVPETVLSRNGIPLSPIPFEKGEHGLFVKPNRLGAKIGISERAHVETLEEALQVSKRIYQDYRDDAVIQTYVAGRNIRASYLDTTANGGIAPLGLYEVDSGADFQSMTESFTLQGEQMINNTSPEPDLRTLEVLNPGHAKILRSLADRLMTGLGLKAVFSLDFRLTDEGEAHILEFEVCPGLPCFDFRHYLREHWEMTLPDAMAATASSFISCRNS